MKRKSRAAYTKDCLKKKKIQIDRIINHPALEVFRSAGLINELKLRNYHVISDYLEFRKDYNHLTSLEKTAKKYFISPEHVLTVMYRKR